MACEVGGMPPPHLPRRKALSAPKLNLRKALVHRPPIVLCLRNPTFNTADRSLTAYVGAEKVATFCNALC
jgi:hypothetical protein